MKEFLGKDFLLETETAKKLYCVAEKMPIFDYHCHLSPKEIYEDKKFSDIADAWLGGDHYKWRLMRESGIDEKFISGNASGKEKFLKYAAMMPYAIGNPLYHWTHLELRRYFNIDTILSPDSAEEIWEKSNEALKKLSARKLIEMSNVKALCTTDDPADTLEYHKKIAEDKSFKVKVLPCYRPDKAVNIELPSFNEWLGKMAAPYGKIISTFSDLLSALEGSIKRFDEAGCVCSDHALDVVLYEDCTISEAEEVFVLARRGDKLTKEQVSKYKGFMLVYFGKLYKKFNWVQQYHIGALRNVSARYMKELGADTGFDAVEDQPFASNLARLMNKLDSTDDLPRTMLYCLNPRDNEVLAALKNCFQAKGHSAKIQFGSAWWFNDQKEGMIRQIRALSQVGLLSKFVGMLTDSRSFLSYPRHEYFRRILCNEIGLLIENGEYPNDIEFAGKVVEDICYNNAKNFFKE